MKAIVAVDKFWGIGKDNDLLFSIPEDMKFFRQTTLNKVVVMGSNTLRSFPNGNPLKNRVNVVLSTTVQRDDAVIAKSIPELFKLLKKYPSDKIFVIGGAMLYKALLPYCESVLVTMVIADGKADAFFENLDLHDEFSLVKQSEIVNSNGYDIKFTVYKNNSVKEF